MKEKLQKSMFWVLVICFGFIIINGSPLNEYLISIAATVVLGLHAYKKINITIPMMVMSMILTMMYFFVTDSFLDGIIWTIVFISTLL